MPTTAEIVFLAAVVGGPLALVVGLVALRSSRGAGRSTGDHTVRVLATTLISLGAVVIVVATLYPVHGFGGQWMHGGTNLEPFGTIDRYVYSSRLSWRVIAKNLAGNVGLFVPLGAGIAIATRRWGAFVSILLALVLGTLASVTVEVLQWLLPLERSVDIDDVILNGAGALLGGVGGAILLRLTGRHRRGSPDRAIEALRS